MIRVECPGCGLVSNAPDEAAGRNASCRKCGERVVIPGSRSIATLAERVPTTPLVTAEPLVARVEPPAVRPTPEPLAPTPAPQPIATRGEDAPTPSRFEARVIDVQASSLIECPFCAEPIQPKAKKCKHCGEILDPVLRKAAEKAAAPAAPQVVIHNTANARSGSDPTFIVVEGGKGWSRVAAGLMSLLIPGLGQLYKGHWIRAILWGFVAVSVWRTDFRAASPIHLFAAIEAFITRK